MVENLECCQFLIWGFSVEGTRFEFHQCIANQILGLTLLITEGNFMLEYIQLLSWKSDTCIFPLRFNNSLNSNHTHVFESVLLTPYNYNKHLRFLSSPSLEFSCSGKISFGSGECLLKDINAFFLTLSIIY